MLSQFRSEDYNSRGVECELQRAYSDQIIGNQNIAYFIGRTFEFLTSIGIKSSRLRFRQHLETERAHYSQDCWDAEVLTSHGWVECVGIADRGCFDLSCHQKQFPSSKPVFSKFIPFAEPIISDVLQINPHISKISSLLKDKTQDIIKTIAKLNEEESGFPDSPISQIAESLQQQGSFTITTVSGHQIVLEASLIDIRSTKKKKTGEYVVPTVIEPSFGIGRIVTGVMEHNYFLRKDTDNRIVLTLPISVAPIKFGLLSIRTGHEEQQLLDSVTQNLKTQRIKGRTDSSATSIGKKYSRLDEIGVPYCVTVDSLSVMDKSITIRERDSMKQIRLPVSDFVDRVALNLLRGVVSWEELRTLYPAVEECNLIE